MLSLVNSGKSIRIPSAKILELEGLLRILIDKKKVKKRELKSLVGKLNFFSKAVRGSRALNRRFYDAMIGVANPHYKLRVSSAVKEDMQMWLQFLDKELGPRTAKLALSICLKLKIIEYV